MILADGSTSTHGSGTYEGRTFVADKDGILAAMSERMVFLILIHDAGCA